jgi:hypothetical protein
VDREKQCASAAGVLAQRRADLARLTQIEAVERLVTEQQRMRRQHADGQQRALALPLRERADPRSEERREFQPPDDVGNRGGRSAEKPHRIVERPRQRLRWPRRDAVGHIEDSRGARGRGQRLALQEDLTRVVRQHARQTLEQRRLARAVGADEAEHFARTDRQRHAGQRGQPAVRLGQAVHSHHRIGHFQRKSLSAGTGYYQTS